MLRRDFIKAVAASAMLLSGTARAQEQDSARAIMEKHGLLGTWAYDCGKRVTDMNNYVVYRPLDERRVQRDWMVKPTQSREVGIIVSVVELGPHEFEIISENRDVDSGVESRDVNIVHVEGNRRRAIESSRNGKKLIEAGRYLKKKENGGWGGRPADWVYRCD